MPKHALRITYTQTTEDGIDHNTIIEDFSKDSLSHIVKAKVMSKHLARATEAISQELADLAIEAMTGGKR